MRTTGTLGRRELLLSGAGWVGLASTSAAAAGAAGAASSATQSTSRPIAAQRDLSLLHGQETAGLDPQELHAYSLGLQAYQYGWPLLYFATLRHRWTQESTGVRRPLNSWIQTREFVATSQYRNGGSFNTDTVYTSAFLDLRDGPMVLSLADPGDRYFSVQISDLYTNNLAYISRRAGGALWGDFLLVPPGWKGEIPAGRFQRVLRVPQSWLFVLVRLRIDQDDSDEVNWAKSLYARNRITPLTDFLAGRQWQALDHRVLDVSAYGQHPLRAFITINHMLSENPPDAHDAPLLQAFRAIGVGPGLDVTVQSAAVQRGLARAARDGLRTLRSHVERPWARSVNGWFYFPTDIGQARTHDYILRSAWQSLWGIVAHPPHECTYLWASQDQFGERLNAQHRYELVMRPSDVPRVEAFWSFTLYQDFNLVPNPINRWAIRENTKGLHREADGTLRILIQRDRPADDRVSNWLPAPESGNFNLTMRNYMPAPEIVEQRYDPPPLRRLT